MNAWLAPVVALGLLCGCWESRVVEAEQRAEQEKREADQFEADLGPLRRAVDGLHQRIREEDLDSGEAGRKLRLLQQALVRDWRGDRALLAAHADKLPPEVRQELEKAQAAAGSTTDEKRFAAALSRGAMHEVGLLLSGWEDSAGLAPSEETGEEACELPAVSCVAIAAEPGVGPQMELCQADSRTMVAGVEDGMLVARKMEQLGPGELRLLRAVGRRWWVMQRELRGSVWLVVFQVSPDEVVKRLSLPVAGTIRFDDVDADGAVEPVVVSGGGLVVHLDPGGGEPEVWTGERACRHATLRGGAAAEAARSVCPAPRPDAN